MVKPAGQERESGAGSVGALAIARVGDAIEVSWPDSATGYALQATASLLPAIQWDPVAEPVEHSGGRFRVLLGPPVGTRFFRLHRP